MISADIRDPAVRRRLDAAIALSAPHIKPLLGAVRNAGVNFAQVPQNTGAFDFPNDRPLITLIGDDYEESLGPKAFDKRSLRKLFKRCRLVVILSGAPEVGLYVGAAAIAVGPRLNTVIVETQPEHEADWVHVVQAARRGTPTIISTPAGPSGARH